MSTFTPNVQARNGHPRDWGNYASLALLPNASGWLGGSLKAEPLEQGDPAFVTGVGRVYCASPGTPGLLDAVWAVTGVSCIAVPVAASTLAGAGTSPVTYSSVYLRSGQTVQASSRALVGAIGGGIATAQVRRQSTGSLVAGFSWSTASSLSNQLLVASVSITADDWYSFEIVSDTLAAYAVVQGVEIML